MKIFNKYYFILLVIFMLIPTFYIISSFSGDCVELVINEEQLMNYCDVSVKEYYSKLKKDSSFCPEGKKAFNYKKVNCAPSIVGIMIITLGSWIIYTIAYWSIYLIIKKLKSRLNS